MKNLIFATIDKNSVIETKINNNIKRYPPKYSTKDALNLFENIIKNISKKPLIYKKFGFNLLPVIYEDLMWLYCFHYVKYKDFFDEFNNDTIVLKIKNKWQLNSVERKERIFRGDRLFTAHIQIFKKFLFLLWIIKNLFLLNRKKIWVSNSVVNDFRYDIFDFLEKSQVLTVLNFWSSFRSVLKPSSKLEDAISNNIYKKLGSYRLWSLAIWLLKPNKIICQDNLFDNYSLLLAAKINNVEIIGVSHGNACFWHRGIVGSKNFDKCENLLRYDKYYCWLPEMKKMLDKNGYIYPKDSVFISGWLKNYSVNTSNVEHLNFKFVLYPYEWFCNHELMKFYLYELNKLNYKIIIKTRPDLNDYSHLEDLDAEFVDNFSSFHYSNASFAIGSATTIIYEFSFNKVPVFLVTDDGYNLFKGIEHATWIKIKNANDLCKKIKYNFKVTKPIITKNFISEFKIN